MAGAQKQHDRRERRERQHSAEDKPDTAGPSSPSAMSSSSYSPPAAFDGNRDPAWPESESQSSGRVAAPSRSTAIIQRNYPRLDVGTSGAYLMAGENIPDTIPRRPAQGNSTGREITIRLNTFNILKVPEKKVYQYDVTVGSGDEKRGVNQRAWSTAVEHYGLGPGWIYDGSKIAWSLNDIGKWRESIDLDKGKIHQGPPRSNNTFQLSMRKSAEVSFDLLKAWLDGKASFSSPCLESINFLDHLLRQTPSNKYVQIKRNFFAKDALRTNLEGGVEAVKGVYASIRAVSTGWGLRPTMSVNVDVANGTFFASVPVHVFAMKATNQTDLDALMRRLSSPSQDSAKFSGEAQKIIDQLKPLLRKQVFCEHRGNGNIDRYIINKFVPATARTHKIRVRVDPNSSAEKDMTVEQFFIEKYNFKLQYPNAPLVQMTKKNNSTHLPMELCIIEREQRYTTKLNERQTSEMIKFAVTLPDVRWQAVQNGLRMLDWDNDRYLGNYGLRISAKPATVKGRILPPPKVGFKNGAAEPKYSGRWDLRGKVFYAGNESPLKSWGVCLVTGRGRSLDRSTVENFVKTLMTTYKNHGGSIAVGPHITAIAGDGAKVVEELYNATGTKFQLRPQLLVFIVPDKGSDMYKRIKKSADCRFGVPSQVLQSVHVSKNQGQYASNVCMKINAKLGGVTSRSIGIKNKSSWFQKKTMIIGADVTHGGASFGSGTPNPSVAAFTVSKDAEALRYIAAVQCNGYRVETITKRNIENMLRPIVSQWASNNSGSLPEHIIYMRDGVSEGEFAKVIQQEVLYMREMLRGINAKTGGNTQFTVITCTKRHHIRFFPDGRDGDRNNNPVPGTLVEVGCTHPFEYDFYLCAHSAIKGTARPVHYTVLLDEAKMDPKLLINFIYESSYQYARSTTPVSYFPAIYYAHLAAARATAHYSQPAVADKGKKAATGTGGRTGLQSSGTPLEPPTDLIPLCTTGGIQNVMWYI